MRRLLLKKLHAYNEYPNQIFYFFLLLISFFWLGCLFIPFKIELSGRLSPVNSVDQTLTKFHVILQPKDIGFINKHKKLALNVSGSEIPVRISSIITTGQSLKLTLKPLSFSGETAFNLISKNSQSEQPVSLIGFEENMFRYLWVKLFYECYIFFK